MVQILQFIKLSMTEVYSCDRYVVKYKGMVL